VGNPDSLNQRNESHLKGLGSVGTFASDGNKHPRRDTHPPTSKGKSNRLVNSGVDGFKGQHGATCIKKEVKGRQAEREKARLCYGKEGGH